MTHNCHWSYTLIIRFYFFSKTLNFSVLNGLNWRNVIKQNKKKRQQKYARYQDNIVLLFCIIGSQEDIAAEKLRNNLTRFNEVVMIEQSSWESKDTKMVSNNLRASPVRKTNRVKLALFNSICLFEKMRPAVWFPGFYSLSYFLQSIFSI